MRANFQQEGKTLEDRQRRKSLPRQGVSTEAQLRSTTGGIPSGPYALLVSRPERVEKTSFEEIMTLGRSKSEGGGEGGTAPESSKVEFLPKVWEKSVALSEEEMTVEPSERKRGGKEEEEKLLEICLARCQKACEE